MKFYRLATAPLKFQTKFLKQNFTDGARMRILAMKTRNVKFSDTPSRHDETANASPVRTTQEEMF